MPRLVAVALVASLALAMGTLVATGARSGSAAASPASTEAALPTAVQECLACHEEPHVLALLGTPHAVGADPRTGFASQGCATCHGPSQAHMQRPARGQPRAAPDHVFGKDDPLLAPAQNAVCLACHQGQAGLHWQGSVHEVEDLGCTACHSVHAYTDPVLVRDTEAAVCTACHARTHAEALRPSAHPMLDGRMACSDCHAPHGGPGPALLRTATVNETCTSCHAEFRGPFLWEHPPVTEDCLSCHRPHGASHRPLLVKRTPWLCQDCHLAQFHPSAALSGTGLPGATAPSGSQSMLGRDCMNCHVHVHGSNHPSGAGTTR